MDGTDVTARASTSLAARIVYESPPLAPEDVADTTAALVATYARDTSAAGICVADGMGLRLAVERGALIVEDGMGPHRRHRRFEKATHGLRRLVILGPTGSVSLDTLHWCRRLGVGVVVLAPDGSAALASTPRMTDDARLRRIQALAPDLPVGLDLARGLLVDKMTGQAHVLAACFEDHEAACTVADLVTAAEGATTVDDLRQLEASAAALYWQRWVGREECVPRFAIKDLKRIPPHWTRYEGRRSVLASVSSNRKAERPVNGILNYLYALLEAEAILAAQAVGLDPGLGIVHLDTKGRQSMALDLMEPVRPAVDAFVLDLLQRRTFRKAEFTETPDGHCRLKASLTHDLAEMMPEWARTVAPVAERVAHALGRAMAGKYVAATPLTTSRHRQAQALSRSRVARGSGTRRAAQRARVTAAPSSWACPDCGGVVTDPRHIRCDACIDTDPRQAPEVRSRRGEAISARKRALREWDEANPGVEYDPDFFRREILPALRGVKLADIMAAAGISKGYASQVRAGRFTPHVSTWHALARSAGVSYLHAGADNKTSSTPNGSNGE
jgi:CRISPR-associated endonuclease Cas1